MIFNSGITIQHCLEQICEHLSSEELFYGHGTDNAWDEACWLLEAVLKREGVEELSEQTLLNQTQAKAVSDILTRRINEKKPLAYLLNEAWFAGHSFYVDERVLVPRSPIAELINNGFEPLLKHKPNKILDLCCGGGCIGIASALAFPESRVELADISKDALAVAQKNIKKHDLEGRVSCHQSDIFKGLEGAYDLILSNPPYVSQSEYDELPAEYHQEPVLGLVSFDNGLAIPTTILLEAVQYLNEDGLLILEVGYSWQALIKSLPHFPFLWLDFEFGGEGICAISRKELHAAVTQTSTDGVQ